MDEVRQKATVEQRVGQAVALDLVQDLLLDAVRTGGHCEAILKAAFQSDEYSTNIQDGLDPHTSPGMNS